MDQRFPKTLSIISSQPRNGTSAVTGARPRRKSTRPRRTESRTAARRRIASKGVGASSTRKLASFPAAMPYSASTPSAFAPFVVTSASAPSISSGLMSCAMWIPASRICIGSPSPSGYQGSSMESCAKQTFTPAARSSFTRVSPRRFG